MIIIFVLRVVGRGGPTDRLAVGTFKSVRSSSRDISTPLRISPGFPRATFSTSPRISILSSPQAIDTHARVARAQLCLSAPAPTLAASAPPAPATRVWGLEGSGPARPIVVATLVSKNERTALSRRVSSSSSSSHSNEHPYRPRLRLRRQHLGRIWWQHHRRQHRIRRRSIRLEYRRYEIPGYWQGGCAGSSGVSVFAAYLFESLIGNCCLSTDNIGLMLQPRLLSIHTFVVDLSICRPLGHLPGVLVHHR